MVLGALFASNLCSQRRQNLRKSSIPPVDMFRVADHAGPGRGQRRHHQCSPAPQIRRSQLRAPQRPARPDAQCSSIDLHLRAKAFKTDGAAEPPLKDDVFDAALPLGAEHGGGQQGRSVGGETRVHPGEDPARPVQPPETGHLGPVCAPLHGAAHLFQNFQHRRIERGRASGEFHPPSGSSDGTGQRGGEDSVRQGRKIATGKPPPPLDAQCGSPRTLDTPAAAVQKFGQVGDLRFPRRAPQDGGASGADSSQQQGLRRSHAGETEGDVGPVEAPRRGQHQLSRPGVQLLCPHPGQTFQM